MSEVVFDSAILVDALVGQSAARTEIVRSPERWITRLGWTEVLAGAKGDAARIEDFLSHFKVIELTEEIARRGAALREQRAAMALADAIALASAQVTGRIFVTRNLAAFPAQMPGVRIPYTL
ncbi:PIN domain-containing protein [Alteriqipengyuania sp. WL0013]|uniref:PIN domain-containing protein n=1 Tax=Alteriqipengyuania sp. WL0013 TaxID=3110773 RepID=UPI002C978B18|nr:PIN domain-containing protein [Alteriqipengyuania sp. WL0013]MEB3415639.1 PIN domain-containing protein [Alteriqipengyuania sp. WL0013]